MKCGPERISRGGAAELVDGSEDAGCQWRGVGSFGLVAQDFQVGMPVTGEQCQRERVRCWRSAMLDGEQELVTLASQIEGRVGPGVEVAGAT